MSNRTSYKSAAQSEKGIIAYFAYEHLLPFGFGGTEV